MTHTVLFDASRLLSRTDRSAPTGIDRVCLAYADWLRGRSDMQMIPVRTRKGRLAVVDPAWFDARMDDLRRRWSGPVEETEHERRLLNALHDDAPTTSVICPPPTDQPGRSPRKTRVWTQYFRARRVAETPAADLYFNVGHTGLDTPDILAPLAAQGVKSVVLLHDLIPITHPEYCRPGDDAKHRARVVNTLRHASQIIVNSAYTGDELAAFARREALVQPTTHVAHLGLEDAFLRPLERRETPHPYFVHIGTIEARKNLAFLLTLWRRLQERMGANTPRLVLIGRYGWENEAVLDHLERSPNLQGLVHQAENLPDRVLYDLMAGARALLAPSSVEGFDLPAVEASALSVPVIASDIPPHRELIPHARQIDPLDGPGWLEALEAATRKPVVAPAFSPPSWPAHFDIVAAALGLPLDRFSVAA